MRVSVIIPVLNEESCLEHTLHAVQVLKPWELIVADGGSADRTVSIASNAAQVLHAPRGRGAQQKAAATDASGDVLWFLHADTVPGTGALDAISSCLREEHVAGGNFSLRFDGGKRSAEQLTRIYPWLRLLGLCYGDSGIFVRRSVYFEAGEFQPYPLFEDVDLVRRIRKLGKFRTLPDTLTPRLEDTNIKLCADVRGMDGAAGSVLGRCFHLTGLQKCTNPYAQRK